MIDVPEENVSHFRVARSPQFGHHHHHHGGGGFGPGPARFGGGGGYYPQPQVSQSQATAQAQSFNLQGPFGGGLSFSNANAQSGTFSG